MVRHAQFRAGCAVALAAGALAPGARSLALPPASIAVLYRSGNPIPGAGAINGPFFTGGNGGEGFRGVAVNNSNRWLIHLGIYASPGFNQALIESLTAPAPYLAAGAEAGDPGSVSVPSSDYTLDSIYSTSINAAGDAVLALRLRSSSFAMVAPTTGIYFNRSAMPIREGDPVAAAGVALGTTFAPFDAGSVVQINDSNLVLIGTRIIEAGITRNAILKAQPGPAGALLSTSLVAKEGGPVGPGPATWATVSIGPHTCAINNAGDVVHSGITSTGVNGLFVNGIEVARQGGASPASGLPWGPLAGAPVDINNRAQWAVRAPVYGDNVWNEVGEAGETFTSGGGGTTGNITIGGGPLTRITGALASDQDVDVYYIAVGDPTLATQEPFSATTVPDPASGFPGAAFDSVLYLFRDFANANGAFRVGVGRSDNAAPGVQQSTLTTASLPTDHTVGTKYFLAIATPKSRPVTASINSSPARQMWNDDPAELDIVGGAVHWIDPSEGQIGRASLATGSLLPPLTVGVIPPQTVGQVAEDAPLLAPQIAAYDGSAGGPPKLYFLEKRFFPWRLKRCDLDGSNIETILTSTTSNIAGLNVMAVDSVHGKIYWTRPFTNGLIHRANLDGSSPETILTLDSTHVELMALDPIGGRIFYWEPVASSLNRCNLDGSADTFLTFPLNVKSMAADPASRTLYLCMNTGVIRRMNMDTSAFLSDLTTITPATSLTFEPAASRLYWPAGLRLIRRALTAAPTAQDWLTINPDVGERPADGPGYLDAFNAWQRTGSAVNTLLPYQIRLTGATFVNPLALIARSGRKIALAGEPLPATAGDPVTNVGALTSPIKLSDNGYVAWRARWTSTSAPTGTRTAIFLNTEEVFRDNANPNGGGSGPLGTVPTTAYALDMSPSGQYLLASSFNGSFTGINGNACISVAFASIPPAQCAADFNGSGAVTVQDIFDFLAAYFSNSPAADINGSGAVTVQDIFDFLALYFAGCR